AAGGSLVEHIRDRIPCRGGPHRFRIALMVDLNPRALLGEAGNLAARFGDEAYYVALCIRSGLVGVELPHKVAQMLRAFDRFGVMGGALSVAAIRHGDRAGLIDELGELSFKQLDDRSNALANAWRERGLEPGEG